jgi:DNA-binding MarR family transcriptional regulator
VTAGREIAAATGPVGYALAQATRAHRNEMQHRLTQLGLHLGQELLIIDIHQHPDTTQAELVRRIGMEQPTIAKATIRMQRTGFVERIPDPHDRRVIRLRLTERGQAVVEAILVAWADVEATATNGLTQPETEQLTHLLHKIHGNLA